MATLTFVYSDSTAVIGPLAIVPDPHSWDLCVGHAGRITAPRGWELVRHPGPLPANPDEDDLVALANAVREGRQRLTTAPSLNGVPPQAADAAADSGRPVGGHAGMADAGRHAPTGRSSRAGRRRGHLRVLPDPPD